MITPLTLVVGEHEHTAIACGPSDGDLVLFLHGWPEFADSWREVLPGIGAKGYRAVAVDQRGYAAGARPPEVRDYRIDHLVQDVAGFADALGADRFHLVGHDWGGVVAWVFAGRWPERLCSLTVLSTPHPAALAEALVDDPGQQDRLDYARFFQQDEGLAERALLATGSARLRAAYGDVVPEDLVRRNVDRLTEPGALTATLNWYRAVAPELTVAAAPTTVPTLYLWGSRDPALGRAAAERTARHVTGEYLFMVVSGAGHWLPAEVPGLTGREILAHLRSATVPEAL